ncbi:ABC transporter permease subunit [Raoultella planticola]|uniref:ABC transporter permease subunit n=1 Tax=Raoultella planticola TaxID=575 RepID=UPI001D0D40DA|nr:ABC transporter permease subunit [Raoultella planticola]
MHGLMCFAARRYLCSSFSLYGGPYIGINLEAQQVGVLCLGCYGSAYFAEIFRAGRNAVSGGQVEAAADLGLSPWQIFTFIVWPQMLARIIQPLIGQSVILVKESSVLSIITVGELTNTAMTIANQTYAMVEIYALMAIVYWGSRSVSPVWVINRAPLFLFSIKPRLILCVIMLLRLTTSINIMAKTMFYVASMSAFLPEKSSA